MVDSAQFADECMLSPAVRMVLIKQNWIFIHKDICNSFQHSLMFIGNLTNIMSLKFGGKVSSTPNSFFFIFLDSNEVRDSAVNDRFVICLCEMNFPSH
jgi:hypothetical protein